MGSNYTMPPELLARRRAQLVQTLTSAMHEAQTVGFWKLTQMLRDRALPLAYDEIEDAARAAAQGGGNHE